MSNIITILVSTDNIPHGIHAALPEKGEEVVKKQKDHRALGKTSKNNEFQNRSRDLGSWKKKINRMVNNR